MEKHNFSISINLKKISTIFIRILFLLILANIVSCLVWFKMGHPYVYGIVPEFNFNKEGNIPTYFSLFILLISAVLLKIIALFKKKENDIYSRHWSMLALIFLYLSIDESVSIHELLNSPLRDTFQLTGIFYYSWVIAGIAVVLIFSIFYYKFLFSLPLKTRYGFILAAVFYIGGAVGMELIGANYHFINGGYYNLSSAVSSTIEESFEMLGIIIFINTLLSYIENHIPNVVLNFKS